MTYYIKGWFVTHALNTTPFLQLNQIKFSIVHIGHKSRMIIFALVSRSFNHVNKKVSDFLLFRSIMKVLFLPHN